MNAVGECIISTHYDHARQEFRAVVDRADPRIRISTELLREVRELGFHRVPQWMTLDGDVLTLNADNRKVVYRIDYSDFDGSSYGAEWPD